MERQRNHLCEDAEGEGGTGYDVDEQEAENHGCGFQDGQVVEGHAYGTC